MTENEAIELIEKDLKLHSKDLSSKYKNGLRMAIQALEKQIPKKPRFYAHNYHCSVCGNLVGNNEFEWQRFLYCDNCGTKIDWQ